MVQGKGGATHCSSVSIRVHPWLNGVFQNEAFLSLAARDPVPHADSGQAQTDLWRTRSRRVVAVLPAGGAAAGRIAGRVEQPAAWGAGVAARRLAAGGMGGDDRRAASGWLGR